jgi:polyhydroxyalkanoate synthesis repressor PhaR
MPYVIKRYPNRKLYDTRSKRYLTLDDVAVLVKAGEEIRVEDSDSGEVITGKVLAKIIADGRGAKGGLLPQKLLVDLIQRPRHMVTEVVKSSISAGQRTVDQIGAATQSVRDTAEGAGAVIGGLISNPAEAVETVKAFGAAGQQKVTEWGSEFAKLLAGVLPAGPIKKDAAHDTGHKLASLIDKRLKELTKDLPTRQEVEKLQARVRSLETEVARAARPARPTATAATKTRRKTAK